jgi:hypothetical protein
MVAKEVTLNLTALGGPLHLTAARDASHLPRAL